MPTALILGLVQILLQYGPEAFASIVAIVHNPNPTKEDWDKIVALVSKPYESYTGNIPNPYVPPTK